jgi:hypothetical protein
MTTSPASRTAGRILAAAALSTVALAGLSGTAGAETPPFEPGVEIVVAPQPTIPPPDPAPEVDLPLADPCGQTEQGCPQPEPEPEPPVVPDLPLADPCGQTEEGCPQPDPDPGFEGADDFTDDPCNHLTHGCGEDEDIDDFTDNPADPDGEDPGEGGEGGEEPEPETDPETEVAGTQEERGALPRTGAGFALIAGLGTALVGAGAAAKRAARR